MKLLSTLFALVFLFAASNAVAQKDGGSSGTSRSGDIGLLFSVNQLTPGNYSGGFGGKLYFSNSLAGRLGFGLKMGSDNTQIALAPSITYDFLKSNPLTFYFGGGMSIISASGDKAPNQGMNFGLAGGIGAEWFLVKNVSFSAEYNAIYVNIWSPKNGDSETEFGLGNFGQAILAFYF